MRYQWIDDVAVFVLEFRHERNITRSLRLWKHRLEFWIESFLPIVAKDQLAGHPCGSWNLLSRSSPQTMPGPSEALDSLSQNLGRSSQRESLQQRLGLFSAFFNKWQVVDGSKKSSTLVYHSASVQSHTYRDSILWLSLLLLSNGIHCFFWSCFLLLFLLLVNQNHNHRCVQMLRLQRALRRLAFVSLFGAMLQPMLSCRPVGHLGIGEIKFVTWMSRAKWAQLQFLWLRFLWLSCGWPPFRRPKPSWRMSKVLWQHPEFWPCTCQSEGKQKNCFGVPKIGRPGEAVLNGDLWCSFLKHLLGRSPTFFSEFSVLWTLETLRCNVCMNLRGVFVLSSWSKDGQISWCKRKNSWVGRAGDKEDDEGVSQDRMLPCSHSSRKAKPSQLQTWNANSLMHWTAALWIWISFRWNN